MNTYSPHPGYPPQRVALISPEIEAMAKRIRQADENYQHAMADVVMAQALLYDEVQSARAAGMLWQTVAGIFGTSMQAVQQRFSKPAPGQIVAGGVLDDTDVTHRTVLGP